jgi:hypothetical protein
VKSCSWCDNTFTSVISYQIYCSVDCRNAATKEKIAERHKVLRIKKRRQKIRFCASECGEELSIYNDDIFCESCNINNKELKKKLKEIKRLTNE